MGERVWAEDEIPPMGAAAQAEGLNPSVGRGGLEPPARVEVRVLGIKPRLVQVWVKALDLGVPPCHPRHYGTFLIFVGKSLISVLFSQHRKLTQINPQKSKPLSYTRILLTQKQWKRISTPTSIYSLLK